MCSPTFDLPPHRIKVPLHPVHPDRKRIVEREALRVFRQDGSVVTSEREVVADEYSQSDRACQPESPVVRVPNPNCKSTSLETGFLGEHAEHLHRIARHCKLLVDNTHMSLSPPLD